MISEKCAKLHQPLLFIYLCASEIITDNCSDLVMYIIAEIIIKLKDTPFILCLFASCCSKYTSALGNGSTSCFNVSKKDK